MWEAVLSKDGSMNGRFITGVHSTGIYCLPSCPARKPKRVNVRFYRDPADAQTAGLRACKKCRPDDFYSGEDAARDRLVATISQVFACPFRFPDVASVVDAFGQSAGTLHHACREHYHETPGALIARARLEFAQRELVSSSDGAVEVGVAAGYESTSAFYERFRSATGLTPIEYRRLDRESSFVIQLPAGYPVAEMRRAWERDPLSVTDRWDGDDWTLTSGDTRFTATFEPESVAVVVAEGSARQAHTVVTRLLNLARDPGPFERAAAQTPFADLVARRPGLRIPLTPNHFEGLIWAIVGQQVNLPFAFALRRRLCELAGMPMGDLFAHPSPAQVAGVAIDDLLARQFSRRKAEYVIGLSRAVADGALDLEALSRGPATVAHATLVAQRGLGPWSANYIMIRAMGFADGLPIGDTGLTSGLQRVLALDVRPDAAETTRLMEPIRPFRSLATFHLWRSLHDIP